MQITLHIKSRALWVTLSSLMSMSLLLVAYALLDANHYENFLLILLFPYSMFSCGIFNAISTNVVGFVLGILLAVFQFHTYLIVGCIAQLEGKLCQAIAKVVTVHIWSVAICDLCWLIFIG